MSGDHEKCLQSGCDDYMSKPVDVRKLLSLVERRLGVEKGPVGGG